MKLLDSILTKLATQIHAPAPAAPPAFGGAMSAPSAPPPTPEQIFTGLQGLAQKTAKRLGIKFTSQGFSHGRADGTQPSVDCEFAWQAVRKAGVTIATPGQLSKLAAIEAECGKIREAMLTSALTTENFRKRTAADTALAGTPSFKGFAGNRQLLFDALHSELRIWKTKLRAASAPAGPIVGEIGKAIVASLEKVLLQRIEVELRDSLAWGQPWQPSPAVVSLDAALEFAKTELAQLERNPAMADWTGAFWQIPRRLLAEQQEKTK